MALQMTKRLKRPRDPVQLGKLIGDILTGQVKDEVEDKRNPAAVELGRKGGLKGGKARAAKLIDTTEANRLNYHQFAEP